MNTELVLDTAYINTAISLIVDEHRESASVASALYGTSQHEVDVRVTISDETLYTVQAPAVLLLVECCLQHYRLQVGTGIWFSEVHRHSFSGTYTWDVTFSLVFVAKLIESLDTILQRPDVLESCITLSDDFVGSSINCVWQVQTTIAARHSHTAETSLVSSVEVLVSLRCVAYATILAVRSLSIYVF